MKINESGDGKEFITCEEGEANAHLIVASPNMYNALKIQEDAKTLTLEMEKGIIPSDHLIYEKWLGKWNGYQAPEVRFEDFTTLRKKMRREAIAEAEGKTIL